VNICFKQLFYCGKRPERKIACHFMNIVALPAADSSSNCNQAPGLPRQAARPAEKRLKNYFPRPVVFKSRSRAATTDSPVAGKPSPAKTKIAAVDAANDGKGCFASWWL
jgi:hypothetical protein